MKMGSGLANNISMKMEMKLTGLSLRRDIQN